MRLQSFIIKPEASKWHMPGQPGTCPKTIIAFTDRSIGQVRELIRAMPNTKTPIGWKAERGKSL